MKRLVLALVVAVALMLATGGRAFAAHSDYGCHNCHVPHHAGQEGDADASWGVPLWSTAQTSDGLPTFDLYSSASFDALQTDIGQPDGATKLCLGCHDGSYVAFSFMPESDAIFGTGDLATSHPVSFTYDAALAQKTDAVYDPTTVQSGLGGTIDEDLLDGKDKMQCSSCHDVHTSGIGEFLLRYEYDVATHTDNVMCRVCHPK